ncbi:YlbG family protein [Paenibacillus chitinolyticus]|uniref:DUF2129 domain-containing protein n=1 Tax=Paenibacillus chitinolyticus TaxID=79263 RepID=A0A410X117_9BACL|nr:MULTISPECIES: YlbG family protein [Paenibacillus]EGL18962.1 hypothetical protein HMPREF9413_3171 [Paenibacillus sp. HGF7]EPD92160.1 hypothetical protein HMPREF1207_00826 [Paenibacillus sp. HGH0039]MBV6712825.1 YlbG family protein [Paenibacillus chitinolyticus]MCY9588481.1 YlbG family protein [Paenibacillus chitinolyticus]MCY9597851.1 YlbG family protein [Paenibacillus chitinolyticus]
MITERTGLIIWVTDLKAAKNLERFGSVHYMSKKMHYVVLYIHASRYDETVRQLQKLAYVRKVERSYRGEIKTEYESHGPDKSKFYTL